MGTKIGMSFLKKLKSIRKDYKMGKKFVKKYINARYLEVFGHSDEWLKKNKDEYRGQACFVIGNGPSLRNVHRDILKQLPSFGANGIFLHFTPTFFVTISSEFYKSYVDEIRNLLCSRKFIGSDLNEVIIHDINESLLTCSWNIYGDLFGKYFPVPMRFSKNADRVVYLGGTVLFVCLQLAYWLGFQKVILLGVDHNFGLERSSLVYGGTRLKIEEEDKFHFSEKYLPKGANPHCDMLATERAFKLALEAFQTSKREIVNATYGTSLDVIPKIEIGDIL